MKNTQELVHALYVLDLIKDLRRKNTGFKSVEERAACMCRGLPGGRKRTLVNTIMNWKLKDAHEEFRKARCKKTREWREIYPIVIFLEFHSTKQGLPLVDSWSRGLE